MAGEGWGPRGGTVGIGFGVRLLLLSTGSAICHLNMGGVDEVLLGICFPTKRSRLIAYDARKAHCEN